MPLAHDPAVRKLGAIWPPVRDPRNVRLARALAPASELPPPKKSVHNSRVVKTWPMLRNDELGDCVPAGILHKLQVDKALAGHGPWVPTDEDAVLVYEQVAGYKPSDPSTDQGTVELTAMKDWRKGLRLTGGTETILGFAAVDPHDAEHIKIAIDLFGGVLTGIGLPVTAQQQRRWTVKTTHGDGAPGSWGGHCTYVPDYSGSGLTNITWAEKLNMSWAFLGTYADELWAVITQAGIDKAGTYKGIDEKILLRDLGLL